MEFDIDTMSVKRNTIPRVDAISRLEFDNKKIENYEYEEDKILYWLKRMFCR